jgi:hypothetical protein
MNTKILVTDIDNKGKARFYMGAVQVRNDKKMIWTEVTNIKRLTRKDAQSDADILRSELENTYNKELKLNY